MIRVEKRANDKMKWPKFLDINMEDQTFDKNAFYSWKIVHTNRVK